MSAILLRVPVIAFITVAAWATDYKLLPMMLGFYVLTVGSEAVLAYLVKRWLVEELESLRRAVDQPPPPQSPPLLVLASLLWQTVLDTVWAVADRLVVDPLYRRREQRGEYSHQGRHHTDRWARHELHGTVAQRRPSAASQQRLVAAIVKADTDELPVIDDTTIEAWLRTARVHEGVT